MSSVRPRKLVVGALIRRDGDRGPVLMSRRRADQVLPLLWEFPGGKIEPGEAPEQALAREVREELGCGVAVGRIHDVVFHAYPDFDIYMLVYPCTIVDGSPSAVDVAEIAWVEPARLPDSTFCPPTSRSRVAWPPRTPEPLVALWSRPSDSRDGGSVGRVHLSAGELPIRASVGISDGGVVAR